MNDVYMYNKDYQRLSLSLLLLLHLHHSLLHRHLHGFLVIPQILRNPREAFLLQRPQDLIPAVLLLLNAVLHVQDEQRYSLSELNLEVIADRLIGEVLLDQLDNQ